MRKTFKKLSFILVLVLLISMFSGVPVSAAIAPYIKSNSPSTVNMASRSTVEFKFTLVGKTGGKPIFTAGNPNVVEILYTRQEGTDYYVKVTDAGVFGEGAGLYSQLPGQAPVRQMVINTTERIDDFETSMLWHHSKYFTNYNKSTRGSMKQWVGSAVENHLFGEDDYSGALLTVTNSNPDVLQISAENKPKGDSIITINATSAETTEEIMDTLSDRKAPIQNRFIVTATKAGTGTITITWKSPKTGKTFTDTEVYTVLDQPQNSITTDTSTQVDLGMNQSYTFKCTVSSSEASKAWFYTTGNVYVTDSSGTETTWNWGLKTEYSYAGNGVYYVKVTAVPFGDSGSLSENIRSGETFPLMWGMPGLEGVPITKVICSIKIV